MVLALHQRVFSAITRSTGLAVERIRAHSAGVLTGSSNLDREVLLLDGLFLGRCLYSLCVEDGFLRIFVKFHLVAQNILPPRELIDFLDLFVPRGRSEGSVYTDSI